ncbi:zinc-ribbon domain-containing protein [Tateyamaria sp.]|uniref:zinc-ribbon domain-containing protein n=1 Tax=Tateyamaria sp. TaxID=1929288 RepID=UPI00329D461B
MRLICPNCDAQYEVTADVIPHDGRDVQCSNCGKTWFQHHPDHIPEVEPTPELPQDSAVSVDSPAPDEERVATDAEPQRRELDASITDILRQEADLESKARASEGLESQPELGLESGEGDVERRAREAQERTARIRGEDPSETAGDATAVAAAIGSRRDLLPDIEEINSTLRSTSDRQIGDGVEASDGADMPAPKPSKSRFRLGFMLVLVLVLILLAIYIFAPQIAQAVPQVDPYLSGYVAKVDAMRLWLDGKVTNLLTWLDAIATAQES